MGRSFSLGKLAGIPLFVHWTFGILPVTVFLAHASDGLRVAGLWVIILLTVFACVILHELGHALAARRYGIPTRDITIYPIGGVARLERMSEKPIEEIVIALAGPAVNVVIALLLGLVMTAGRVPLALDPAGGSVSVFLTGVMLSNVVLVFFNLLPTFPMDGGRVLRALLAFSGDFLGATRVAAGIGAAMAGLFVLGGLLLTFRGVPNGPVLMLVGGFVFFVGQMELAAVKQRFAARERAAWRAAAGPADDVPEALPAEMALTPPEPGFSGYTFDHQLGCWVEWRQGRPVRAC
jgi:Zn-dependent protease